MTTETTTNNNYTKIVQYLYRHPRATRTDIYQGTGITPATVSQTVATLIADDLVLETGLEVTKTKGSGRKQKVISLNASYGTLLGIDFTLAGMTAVLTDITGHVLDSQTRAYTAIAGKPINDSIVAIAQKLIVTHQDWPILGVGLSIPGHYSVEQHSIISNNPMWDDFDLQSIRNQLGLPVLAENNVESMALSRYLFSADDSPEKFLFLQVGFGLYCAFLEPNNLHPKQNYYIGEIGHTVVNPDGALCECGKRGCLQTYISETWLVKRAKQLFELSNTSVMHSLVHNIDEIDLNTVLAAFDLGDPYITNTLDRGIEYLGISVANLLMMCDADAIYINSRILQRPDFNQRVTETIANQLKFIPTKKNTAVKILPYEETRGALGACALAAFAQVVRNESYHAIVL